MQDVRDTYPTGQNQQLLRPFGPTILKREIPDEVLEDLGALFANNTGLKDHSLNLAGNMQKEFTIDQDALDEGAAHRFTTMLADGSGELYSISKRIQWEATERIATEKHREIVNGRLGAMQLNCVIHQSWGNISVAGDWNPTHSHSGAISGVGYVRLPDDIEDEWANEDHDPSAGMIQFTYGNPQDMQSHNVRFKPEVGAIYFFPAWLLHEVYPFRSAGERWSFSFNTSVTNLMSDTDLTDEDKIALIEHREANAQG